MGEVINFNKYCRDRRRKQKKTASRVVTAKIEPRKYGSQDDDVRQLEDKREPSSTGVLFLPLPVADEENHKEGGPETA
jgi:hypothetical protein